jgi:hypothetical protein
MNLNTLKKYTKKSLLNLRGWRTNKKIVVIESDDWGSIRMPSKEVYNTFLKAGIPVNKCAYNKYDSLESEEDLSLLFELLLTFKDKNGLPPKITANTIVANPDFKRIEDSDFKKYEYELFTKTLESYPKHKNTLNKIKEGIESDIFFPQLHGREHLNINRWMYNLRSGSQETKFAFDHKMFGLSTNITKEKRQSYMAALDVDDHKSLIEQKAIIEEAQSIFEQTYGYKSISFIAPNYTWSSDIEPFLKNVGIKFIQGSASQALPQAEKNQLKFKRHYTGEKNNLGQIYLVRNCSFEPSLLPESDVVSECLNEIQTSFFWKKPAIISSHRLNFIGSIDESNRSKNLMLLQQLLKKVLQRWPDVEFMTTSQLGQEMLDN